MRLIPIGGDDHLESTRAIIVADLIKRLTIDFGHLIFDELFFHAYTTHTALPFSCLITELCIKDKVSLISGICNEVPALHKQDIEKTKDDLIFDFQINRPPAQQTQSAPVPEPSDFPVSMPLPLTMYMPPKTSSGLASMPMGRTLDSPSVPPQTSEYRLIPDNFAKTIRTIKKIKR